MNNLEKLFNKDYTYILITGGTGFIGHFIIHELIEKNPLNINFFIIIYTRNKQKAVENFPKRILDKIYFIQDFNEIPTQIKITFVINLAGEAIFEKFWDEKQKKLLMASRVGLTKNLINWLASLKHKPKILISASATGIYGSDKNKVFDEEHKIIPYNFITQLCYEWENCALEAEKIGVSTYILRFGLVLSLNGGFLHRLLPPFKMGLGVKIGSGEQMLSWIHIDDVLQIIMQILAGLLPKDVYNIVSPNPVSNTFFTQSFSKIIKRPVFIKLPKTMIKFIMGEMGESLLLESQTVLPKRLTSHFYNYKFSNLDSALKDLFYKKS